MAMKDAILLDMYKKVPEVKLRKMILRDAA